MESIDVSMHGQDVATKGHAEQIAYFFRLDLLCDEMVLMRE